MFDIPVAEDVQGAMTVLNDSVNRERALAEEYSGYTRDDINVFINQWVDEERKGVANFTVPQELFEFFVARAAMMKFIRNHPEIHPYIQPYVRPR